MLQSPVIQQTKIEFFGFYLGSCIALLPFLGSKPNNSTKQQKQQQQVVEEIIQSRLILKLCVIGYCCHTIYPPFPFFT